MSLEGTNRPSPRSEDRASGNYVRKLCDRETTLEYSQHLALSQDDLRVGLVTVQTVVDVGSLSFIQQHRVGV